ncbi:MAG: alpha/beta hydrolase [Alphaproteobacteria bacterium]|nr:alpha/beta hydrolase [Alphaproteobacteria bacterium]
MPDSLPNERLPRRSPLSPLLEDRFLAPPGLKWGGFTLPDGAVLRWGHLQAPAARAECVLVGGFGEFIEKHFETVGDLAARGLSVWCLDWRGQGGSTRPKLLPSRPRPRRFDRDARELGQFTAAMLSSGLPRFLFAHSMGGAIALLCLQQYPGLFAGAILSSPMLGLRTGKLPPAVIRCITRPVRMAGLGVCFIPGAGRWRPDRLPSPERSRISSDAERCRIRHAWFSANPALRLDEPTYGWVDTALALVARISRREFLSQIETPILLGSPERETLVAPQAHRQAARLLPKCTLVELRDSKHEPFLERDTIRDQWLGHIDRFIAARLAGME